MSLEYSDYIRTHRMNVSKGLRWMIENLPLKDLGYSDMDIWDAEDHVMVHDASKEDYEEYKPYDAYFYGGNRSNKVCTEFDHAWLRHIHRNPHHWQYWVLHCDDPEEGMKILEIPGGYILEMLADWWSFSWKDDDLFEIFDWYDQRKSYILLHKNTRKLVEKILSQLKNKLEELELEEIIGHSGIPGQKWGVRNGPPYPLNGANSEFKSPQELSNFMKTFKYSEYDKLQSPKETRSKKSGSCHDQVMYELDELRKQGFQPKATFVIEYDPKTFQGGTTHSFVHYKDGDKTVWFENAWGGKEGLHEFNSEKDMLNFIKKNWESSDHKKFTELDFYDFKESKHSVGESLQDLVDICTKNDHLEHSELSDEEIEKRKYAFPEERKYPMPDKKHVRSAIKLFNWVDPKDEETLAKAIITRMEEYGMSFDDISVGEENRFKKYIPKEDHQEES